MTSVSQFVRLMVDAVRVSHILLSLCIVLVTIIVAKWVGRRGIVYQVMKLPQLKSNFFIGSIAWPIKNYYQKKEHPSPVYIMERMMAHAELFRKEGLYAFWFATTPIITIFKPEYMEVLLSHSVNLDKSHEYAYLHPWLGYGLLTSTGSKWRARRKILTPSFHFRILEDFVPVFNDVSMTLVEKLRDLKDKDFINISSFATLCTLDIITQSIMGVRIGALENSESEYVKAIHDVGHEFNLRVIQPWLWPDLFFALSPVGKNFNRNVSKLHEFTMKVLKDCKEALIKTEAKEAVCERSENSPDDDLNPKLSRKKAFMDLLLDLHINSHVLSEQDIREEVDTFMFEGHDTTAMGITFALYCIGLYPEIQKKIVDELDGIFDGDKQRPVSHEALKEMKYLECVLKESQRLFPSVPMIGRSLSEDIFIGGFKIPKGVTVHCFIYALHRDPELFPNPEVFDPDKFLPENNKNHNPYAYIPFSAGPRNCIGQKFAMMEEKTVVCNILRNFQVVSLDPRDRVHLKMEFVLRSAYPIRLKLIPRV